MNKTLCRLAMALALTSLAGCGLKGPLYFPPQDKPKQSSPQESTPASTATQPEGQQESILASPNADSHVTQ